MLSGLPSLYRLTFGTLALQQHQLASAPFHQRRSLARKHALYGIYVRFRVISRVYVCSTSPLTCLRSQALKISPFCTSLLTSNLDLVVGLLWWVRLLSLPFDFPMWTLPLYAPLLQGNLIGESIYYLSRFPLSFPFLFKDVPSVRTRLLRRLNLSRPFTAATTMVRSRCIIHPNFTLFVSHACLILLRERLLECQGYNWSPNVELRVYSLRGML